ncbi:glucans biosynthesis glucosyltransferase MdoH [Thioflexithrix psekupsensis]|uniref:Glucans biosynthesis glucosyltransferase H n=1 Tax=Thioflexithrix psekupsensis TaxID=1570016 RepID=A0A251X7K4_9GAMM|nr:glucans biosynthesis glucosyltransferase MdoH [Thioflexithrix psekupsensis]OUD13961.1 glucan biosynthesis glucosyltransferase H [Thioflexithrix psekupsensis]
MSKQATYFQLCWQTRWWRRLLFFSLVLLTTLAALSLLTSVFQTDGLSKLELLLLLLYAILFGWICFSFWTALFGFLILYFGKDRTAITASLQNAPSELTTRTALVMPVYNEDPERIFSGLRAMVASLQQTGAAQAFDIYVLSDTRSPEAWVEEELHWQALHAYCQGKINVFYRNRLHNTERKVGNLKDFCQQWGSYYDYMIVLDADSLMSGQTLVKMVRLMQYNPSVALIQVPPQPVNRASLFARIQQFAASVYNPIFTAGLNFWQLSEGNYWGHNAIIRTSAFMAHCGLPKLSGHEPFGGEIFSHDFIEAALLRRAGWQVWLAYDLGESYEEIPPTLIDYARRDRRWCQGNLQHSRLLFAGGFHPINRLHLLMGIMSYLASPLWLLFLIVTAIYAYGYERMVPVYFGGETLFPDWPAYYRIEMMTVFIVTLLILFLPKVLAFLLLLKDRVRLVQHGGGLAVFFSVLLETISSMLLAPIMMLFQSQFVLAILLRRNINWMSQNRDDHQTGLGEALWVHGWHTILGVTAGILAYHHTPSFFWWLTPVLAGLVLAIPLSMLLSHVTLGQGARRWGLFLIPSEVKPPHLLQDLRYWQHVEHQAVAPHANRFIQALLDPAVNALHAALLPMPKKPLNRRYRHYLQGLVYQLLEEGLSSLSASERRALLLDRETVLQLHSLLWSLPEMAESLGHIPAEKLP